MNEAVIERLRSLGLTANEAKVYLTLLGRPEFKAAEVAEQASVPRAKVYEALSSLENKGLCFQVPGNVALYSAIAPDEALPALQRRQEEEQAQQLRKKRELVSELVMDLNPLHESGRSENGSLRYIDVLTERGRITQVANDLLASAKQQILIFEKEPFAQDPATLGSYEKAAAARGVEVRCIVEAEQLQRAYDLWQAGIDVRFVPELPMKLIVSDDLAAICALRDPITGKQSLTSIRIAHPDFARAMHLLFETVWPTATDPRFADSIGELIADQ